ncbi:hypothetical protein SK128_023866 [Halocaridina rubra]|uniref:Uncharacterized protein n=1 Tax=Halocaridina rubra TaxID=373956 RepID=A0AAN8XI75_HALRR
MPKAVQVATMPTVIEPEARRVYNASYFADGESQRLESVLKMFSDYVKSLANTAVKREEYSNTDVFALTVNTLRNELMATLKLESGKFIRFQIERTAILRVWRKDDSCRIRVHIVQGDQFHAILGRRASVGLCLIKQMDNDAMLKPDICLQAVYATKVVPKIAMMDDLFKIYQEVFSENAGKLEGT